MFAKTDATAAATATTAVPISCAIASRFADANPCADSSSDYCHGVGDCCPSRASCECHRHVKTKRWGNCRCQRHPAPNHSLGDGNQRACANEHARATSDGSCQRDLCANEHACATNDCGCQRDTRANEHACAASDCGRQRDTRAHHSPRHRHRCTHEYPRTSSDCDIGPNQYAYCCGCDRHPDADPCADQYARCDCNGDGYRNDRIHQHAHCNPH